MGKFLLKEKTVSNQYNVIEKVLETRDIQDLDKFLNPSSSSDLNFWEVRNVMDGIRRLVGSMANKFKIGIVVDPDADGYTSASIMYQYLKRLDPETEIDYYFHEAKTHGLTEKIVSQVIKSNPGLLIVPDAGSNDVAAIEKLEKEHKIRVLIIDHHEIEAEKTTNSGVILNNQNNGNIAANTKLVGAGMVLRFCQAYDETYGHDYSKGFEDLAAVGQVGDSSDISDPEIRNIVFSGLNNIKNKFLTEVLTTQFGSTENIAPIDLSFSIIPLINAVARVGNMAEKEKLFIALNEINLPDQMVVSRKRKDKKTGKFNMVDETVSPYAHIADLCAKVKTRQNNAVKKIMTTMTGDNLLNAGLVVGFTERMKQGSVTGLVANKLAQKYQKPAFVLIQDSLKDEKGNLIPHYLGSGRGWEKVIPSLKDWANETNLVTFAQGHANAFGIAIHEDKLEDFLDKVKSIEFPDEIIYDVDVWMDKSVDKDIVNELYANKHLFGGKVTEPLIGVTNLEVKTADIRVRGGLVTFYKTGVEFIIYAAPLELIETLTLGFNKSFVINVVGKASENNWGETKTTQIVISDIFLGNTDEKVLTGSFGSNGVDDLPLIF